MTRPEVGLDRVLGFRDLLFVAMGQIIWARVVRERMPIQPARASGS